MSTINERVKEVRKQLHLSQEEFGKQIGLSKSGISNIENGTRNVTSKHIKLISSIFNIDELWLTNGIKTNDSILKEEQNILGAFAFENYLKSLGYSIQSEKTGESKEGHYEEQKDSTGSIVGKSWIPDQEFYSTTIRNNELKVTLSADDLEELQKNVEQMISFELFKKTKK